MKRVADHLSDILASVTALPSLDLQLLDAHGCVIAEDVVAPWPMPQFDNSAMDGYAVQIADVESASPETPVTLPVVADIAAGDHDVHSIGGGFAARIMTGAPMPNGAEAVVPVEWTDGGVAKVTIERAPNPGQGQHIRRAGEDVAAGEQVLKTGSFLGAAQVGLLAAVGKDRVHVRPRPRVVVISTGSELVEPGLPLAPGQVPDSNSYTLTAAAKEAGAIAYRVGAVPDDPKRMLDTIEDQLVRADLVVTSGGVSAGAYDVVKDVLSALGTVTFEKIAMQPGMPQGFGYIGEDKTPIFTLPGNPVSAFVSFEVFVRPAIRKMLGVARLHRPSVRAVLQSTLRSPEGKRQFARARVQPVGEGVYQVTPMDAQGSHLVSDLAYANALIVVPEHLTEVSAGTLVDTMLLERRKG
jgi:molybdopterin molybdotransferase